MMQSVKLVSVTGRINLKKQLTLEQMDSKRRVKEACNLAKFSMEEMAVQCENFHRTLLSTIYGHLQQASKVSSEEALQQIKQSEFFKRSMKDLSNLAKGTVSKTVSKT